MAYLKRGTVFLFPNYFIFRNKTQEKEQKEKLKECEKKNS
jgi:hypothetical protein